MTNNLIITNMLLVGILWGIFHVHLLFGFSSEYSSQVENFLVGASIQEELFGSECINDQCDGLSLLLGANQLTALANDTIIASNQLGLGVDIEIFDSLSTEQKNSLGEQVLGYLETISSDSSLHDIAVHNSAIIKNYLLQTDSGDSQNDSGSSNDEFGGSEDESQGTESTGKKNEENERGESGPSNESEENNDEGATGGSQQQDETGTQEESDQNTQGDGTENTQGDNKEDQQSDPGEEGASQQGSGESSASLSEEQTEQIEQIQEQLLEEQQQLQQFYGKPQSRTNDPMQELMDRLSGRPLFDSNKQKNYGDNDW